MYSLIFSAYSLPTQSQFCRLYPSLECTGEAVCDQSAGDPFPPYFCMIQGHGQACQFPLQHEKRVRGRAMN